MDTESLVIGSVLVVALVLIGVVVYFSVVDTKSRTAVFIRQYIPSFSYRLRPGPIPASGSVPSHLQPHLGPVPAHLQPHLGPVPAHVQPRLGPIPAHLQPHLGPVPAHIQPNLGPVPIHGNVTYPMGYNTTASTLLPGSATEGFANAL